MRLFISRSLRRIGQGTAMFLATFIATGSFATAGDVIHVGPAPSDDFDNIQAAVDAARSGDQILVGAGEYPGFAVAAISLHIAPVEGALVEVRGTMSIRNIPEGAVVSLDGLRATGGSDNGAGSLHGLTIKNCGGSVRIRDCNFEGYSYTSAASLGAFVLNSQNVSLMSCWFIGAYSGAPAHGLLVQESRVAAFDSVFNGGKSEELAGDGVHLMGGQTLFYATGCTIIGGNGIDALCDSGGEAYAGDGGNGLVNVDSDARLQDSSTTRGHGGAGDSTWTCSLSGGSSGLDTVGPVTLIPGVAPELEFSGLVRARLAPLELVVRGTPGTEAYLYASLDGGFLLSPRQTGPRLLGEPYLGITHSIGGGGQLGGGIPLGLNSHLLGVIPGNGELTAQIPYIIGVMNGNVRHVQLQAFTVDAGGNREMSDPRSVSFLPCGSGADCNGNGLSDDCEIINGTSLDCNLNGIPDECEWDCNLNGIPDDCDVASGTSLDQNQNGTADECENALRLFVNKAALPGGDGLTWGTAFRDIQSALDLHDVRPIETEDIWIARGTYKPTSGSNRGIYFRPTSKARLRGGFAGTEFSLSQRNIEANETILSGDLAGNDAFPLGIADNSRHVVLIDRADDVMLDGLTIRGGNADGNTNYGGGIYVYASVNFLISRCTIIENAAGDGGGGVFVTGTPNDGEQPSGGDFLNCSISNNRVAHILPNVASTGGGVEIWNFHNRIRFVNCEFRGNYARWGGGAAWHWYDDSPVEYLGCTIADNVSDVKSPGLHSTGTPIVVQGSILWGNVAVGPGMQDQFALGGHTTLFAARLSCVEGTPLFGGSGVINVDPLFVAPGVGDYRLSAGSPCIDGGRNGAILQNDPSDLDQDGIFSEELPVDLRGVTRRLDDPATVDTGSGASPVVDMGAHEFDPGTP